MSVKELSTEDRQVLMKLLPPTAWNLIAELLSKGNYPVNLCREAIAVEELLGQLMGDSEFQEAFKAQIAAKAQIGHRH